MEYNIHQLPNGIRIIHKKVSHTSITHCGFFINAGSRDEDNSEYGAAHMLEHMLFKGTHRRNTHQVLNRLEVVGGELNAFTTKDKTCVYSSVVKNHFSRAVELLSDITFHSAFPEKELEREKNIILEEIDMYVDTPEERIFDDFQEMLYENHALSHNILGNKESVLLQTKESLEAFRSAKYAQDEVVFAVVGNVGFDRCVKVCHKYLQDIVLRPSTLQRKKPNILPVFHKSQREKYVQAHGIIGGHAYPLSHPLRPTLIFLVNILGGPSLNSRLSLNLREKKGYTYQVDCQYQSFSDAGMVSITWSTDAKNFKRSKSAIYSELKKIREKQLTPAQLKKYKTQITGQLIMAEESNLSILFVLGKGILDLNRVESLPEILKDIETITSEELQQVANEIFSEDKLSSLSYLPSGE